MFSTTEFIEASRKFVCVRIETYENQEAEQLVKKVLRGKYENTAFAIFDPLGQRMLTRGGRSPGMAMSSDRGRTDESGKENAEIIGKMNKIAKQFRPTSELSQAGLQDFHTFRQALNCAAADQRLLVVVNCSQKQRPDVETKLKSVFSDKEIIGKFHLNFINEKTDSGWAKILTDSKNNPGILVVRSGQFGLDGKVIKQLAIDAKISDIKKTFLVANKNFSNVEKRKNYEQHVQAGRREGVTFKNEISKRGASDRSRQKSGRAPRRGR